MDGWGAWRDNVSAELHGVMALADMIGLDVCLAVMEVYLQEFGDSKYHPSPLLKQMVAAARLGRKTGQGLYSH
jgi:3-hydroxybutyryl-CoA dehydrogenase